MGFIIFLILLLIATLIHMGQKRKELERRVEELERLNGVEHYPQDTVGPIEKKEND